MNGLMMDWPLVIPNILRRAAQFFPEKEIVSRRGDGTMHALELWRSREAGSSAHERPAQTGRASPATGSPPVAWNHQRHLELYFAVPSIGAVLHTINFRLARDQLLYIINHAAGPAHLRGQVAGGDSRRPRSASCPPSRSTS